MSPGQIMAVAFEDELEKIARVRRGVKMYRRALEAMHRGKHTYHGTKDAPGIARSGKVRVSTGQGESKAELGSGVYMREGEPVEGSYWGERWPATGTMGGVILPTKSVKKGGPTWMAGREAGNPRDLVLRESDISLSEPSKGKKYLVSDKPSLKWQRGRKDWSPEARGQARSNLKALRGAEKKHKMRPMDVDIHALATAVRRGQARTPTKRQLIDLERGKLAEPRSGKRKRPISASKMGLYKK